MLAVLPPRGWFATIPARNLHACRGNVAHGIVAASENLLAGGTDVSVALLLNGLSSSTGCLDQDKCCGGVGGLHEDVGEIRRTAIDADVLCREIIIGLGSAWGRVGAKRRESVPSIRSEEAIRRAHH